MTRDKMKQALADLKERQIAGENLPCPRCGEDAMKPSIHMGALSRRADVCVCSRCGVVEAMEAFFESPIPLEKWAYFRTR